MSARTFLNQSFDIIGIIAVRIVRANIFMTFFKMLPDRFVGYVRKASRMSSLM
jgi:hypothetical protein